MANFKLTLTLVINLNKLVDQQFASDNEVALKIEDAYKKGLHQDPEFKSLGLRNLIRQEDGMIRFVIPFISK